MFLQLCKISNKLSRLVTQGDITNLFRKPKIVGMADSWKDIVEHAEALHQFDNDLLLKAFREFLVALASALYLFFIVEVFSELALLLLLKRI